MSHSNRAVSTFVIREVNTPHDREALYWFQLSTLAYDYLNLAPLALLLFLSQSLTVVIVAVLMLVGTGVAVVSWIGIEDVLDKQHHYWLIWNEDEVVGSMAAACRDRYTILEKLYVQSDYRRQGIGTDFVQYLINTAVKPIYTRPCSGHLDLYTKLGFSPAPREEVPEEVNNYQEDFLVLR